MNRFCRALAGFITRRSWWIIAAALVLSAAAVPGILQLETETGFSALVSESSPIARDNARYKAQFGSEPVTVMLTGELGDIFSTGNRRRKFIRLCWLSL